MEYYSFLLKKVQTPKKLLTQIVNLEEDKKLSLKKRMV